MIIKRPDNYPIPASEAVTSVMKANKRANTKLEIAIRSSLHRSGCKFRKDFLIRTSERRCRPDIAFTKQKLAVFIDGCFWHLCPEHGHIPKSNVHYWGPKLKRNTERDNLDTNALEAEGWEVLRIWEHVPVLDVVEMIISRVRSRSSLADNI